MLKFSLSETLRGDFCHEELLTKKPLLAFDENADYLSWKAVLSAKLTELLGETPDLVQPGIHIDSEVQKDTYKEIRFSYKSEETVSVSAVLLIPNEGKRPLPVMICLQGHTSGMHISLGEVKYVGRDENRANTRDFAIQAVSNGYAALAIEQRGMGTRRTDLSTRNPEKRGCDFTSFTALLCGRTIIGERVWDVSRAIDTLQFFPELDAENVSCVGSSGGGTATFYAACMDKRIKMAISSCAVCTYRASIADVYHCSCNYIPSSAKYFEMGDLACMIAPRKLLLVNGEKDEIFPIDAALSSFDTIKKIYEKENASGNAKMLVHSREHHFPKKEVWDCIKNFDSLSLEPNKFIVD